MRIIWKPILVDQAGRTPPAVLVVVALLTMLLQFHASGQSTVNDSRGWANGNSLSSAAEATSVSSELSGLDWVKYYTFGVGAPVDDGSAISTDDSGNVYVTGSSIGAGFYDYATVKYGPDGTELWVSRYNGPGNERDDAHDIAVDGAGNIYVTGESHGDTTSIDYATIKYSPDGTELWVARYDAPGLGGFDRARAIWVDSAGNVYVTGESQLPGGPDHDYATIMYDTNGVEQWVARFNGTASNDDYPRGLFVDPAGNVYVTGFTQGDGSTFDYATVKYDPSGIEQWVREYHGNGLGQDEAWDVAVDASGSVYVTGWTTETLGVDYSTVKYNAAGEQQWVARYNGPLGGGDRGRKVAVDAAGDIYVAGTARGPVSFNYAVVKYNPAGAEQWVAIYDGPSNFDDGLSDLVLDEDGNVYVGGTSAGVSTNTDYAIVRYSPLGVEQWVFRHDGPTSDGDGLHALAVDVDGNVFATGSTKDNGPGTSQYMTVKFSQPPGTAVESAVAEINVSFSDIYPNPAAASTTINFVLRQPSRVNIAIHDMMGRVVKKVQDRFFTDGPHSVTWNAADLPAGVYLCTLETGSARLAKTLVRAD